MIRNVCLVAALLGCLALPSTSSAYWPYFGYPGYGWYGGGFGFNQATNYIPSPPYYGVYPPVYYAPYITARHYGASPFAWYPGMQPITYVDGAEGVGSPDPVMIENPFVVGAKTTGAKTTGTIEVQPLKIVNPFVMNKSR
jgi:hypothetical protein